MTESNTHSNDQAPVEEQPAMLGAPQDGTGGTTEKDPDDWVTGDEPMLSDSSGRTDGPLLGMRLLLRPRSQPLRTNTSRPPLARKRGPIPRRGPTLLL